MTPAVTPLCCGSLTFDKSILVAGAYGTDVEAPSLAYLVEADRTILVDTSFGDPDRMDELHPGFDCRRPEGWALPARLAEHGYEPADVDEVVLSHLHWDHCYGLDRFPDAEVHVARRELEYAIAPYPMHAVAYEAKSVGRTPPWLDVDLTPVEGETELCPGVTVFPTPGHTVGHQSVAVETDEGTVVVAVDAVPTYENLEGTDDAPYVRGLAANDFEWWHSAGAVDDRADRVLPGHDWATVDADPPGGGTPP